MSNDVEYPDHYTIGIETYDYISSWNMPFADGCIIKYISRWRHKHNTREKQLEDLKKARFFIDKLIEETEQ